MPALIAVSPLAWLLLGTSSSAFFVALVILLHSRGLTALLSRRERALRSARRQLAAGDWHEAFTAAGRLRDPTRPDPAFERRILSFEGECLYSGAERSLMFGRYAEALELMRGAGDRLGLPEAEFDKRIVSLLLAELRRRMTSDPTGPDVPRLVQETLRVAGAHPEASFWLAMHHLHAGHEPQAREALHDALADAAAPDPALYLGVLCRRAGQTQDALRWLGRALGSAAGCPLVHWHFAAAAIEAGADPAGAVKSLEKVTGPDGFPKYLKEPHLIWATLGPRSWIAALVHRLPLPCPLGLDRPADALAEARRMLAVGLEKCDRPTDAATVYYQAYSAGDRTHAVQQGLGLNLARAGLYDDALPLLQAAHALEQPPTPITTSYLALSTARARASSADERTAHIHAALDLLASTGGQGNGEWVKLVGELSAEAKDAGVELTPRQRLEVARAFAAVDARDAGSVDAYRALAGSGQPIPFEVAAVFAHAAAGQVLRSPADVALLDEAFRDRDRLRAWFKTKQWDATAAERAYLEASAAVRPGRYPETPGPLYPALAERMLFDEYQRHEREGRPDAAAATLKLIAALGPHRPLTLDRFAQLADCRGDTAECHRLLDLWEQHHPHDARPLARRALLEFRAGRVESALEALTVACGRATGHQRARLLCLTARVALASRQDDVAIELFDQARLLAPNDPEPVTGLAALAWTKGDYDRLAALAPLFDKARNADPFRAMLACLAFALAGDEERSEAEFAVAACHPPLAPEAAYLRAVLLAWQRRDGEARQGLEDAVVEAGPTRDHVHALAGQLAWQAGDYPQALEAWGALPPDRRAQWNLDPLFPAALFLGGAAKLAAGAAAEAADLLDRCRATGYSHPRLAPLLALARQRAAQTEGGPGGPGALRELETALLAAGPLAANSAAWLARGYRKQGDLAAARRALDQAPEPTGHVWLQKGLLELAEDNLVAAEAAFAAARNRSPDAPAAAFNLALTRLSLGRLELAAVDLARAAELHPSVDAKRVLAQLAALAPGGARPELLARLTIQDEQRLIKRLHLIGRIDAALAFVNALAAARPDSAVARQARADLHTLWVRDLLDRGEPRLALSAGHGSAGGKPLANLLGIAAALTGAPVTAIEHFHAALPVVGDDARVEQNLALTALLAGDASRARIYWQRYLASMAAHCPAPPGDSDYLLRLGELIRRRLTTEDGP